MGDVKGTPRWKKPEFTAEEKKLEVDMLKMWTNFAKYGNPTPRNADPTIWSPVTLESGGYMNITSSPTIESQHLMPWRTLLWKRMVYGPLIDKIDARIVYERASEFLGEQLPGQIVI